MSTSHSGIPHYIAIEGVIGAGKTTLAQLLSERLNARLILEQFEENPFLPDFYKDQERYAFQTQMYFLLNRYRQQQELNQLDLFHEHVVSDYVFDKDRIFASVNLNEHEFSLYESLVRVLEDKVARPDLLIYLDCNLNRLIQNIRRRNRPMEQSISVGYLRDLSEAYTQYFTRYTGVPVMIVNIGKMDFLNDPQVLDELIRQISLDDSAQIRFFQPPPNSREN